MPGLSKEEIQVLADAYLLGENIAGTKRADDMALAYADRVQREFRKLKGKITVEFTERDPYTDHGQLAHDVLVNRRMYVFTGFSDTPLWTPEINWMARAVHDYDHVVANTDFSLEGEVHAFQVGAEKAPQLEPLFLSEIALQAAVSVVTGSFSPGPQKLVVAPESVAKIARRYRRNSDQETKEAAHVWDAAGALKIMGAEDMMSTLAAQHVAFEDALTLVLAAETAQDLSGASVKMYATPYVRPEGFGSVGYLEDIRDDSVTIADPIFGTTIVSPGDCFGVLSTETGSFLPGVQPTLIASPLSTGLLGEQERLVANEAEVIMLRPRHFEGEEFPSGYPHAWDIIRRWREGVGPDWRTIALSAIFARFSIQRPIEEAEALFRAFGPTIREAMLRGTLPSEAQLARMKGIKGTRAVRTLEKGRRKGEYSWDDIPAILSIFEWAPWVARKAEQKDYSRGFRDMVAVEWAPRGLGIAKISFTMMLMGRDAACMDTRMQRFFFGEYDQEADASFQFGALEDEEDERELGHSPERVQFEKKTSRRRTGKGAQGVTRKAIETYRDLEDRLAETPYFDPAWPMPYAKAQWMLWETLGRTATTANHGALWEVIGPLISDIDAGR